MIEAYGIGFSYGSNRILKDISVKLGAGQVYGLVGMNGSGKTTLLSLLCGLKKPDSGSLLIDGDRPYDKKPSTLCRQYFLPDEATPFNMKAENFAIRTGAFWPLFDIEVFRKLMDSFSVECGRKMNRMSAGQLKKTYISFAIATGAGYLFMDEPTNGLDIPSKSQFRKIISECRDNGACIIMSTHQIRDIREIIDSAIMLEGQSARLIQVRGDDGSGICPEAINDLFL